MFRTFTIYTFVIPNRVEYRELLRKLDEVYDYKRLLFEIYNLDHLSFYIEEDEPVPLERLLESSETLSKLNAFSKYAFAYYHTERYYKQRDDGEHVLTDHIKSNLNLSNLDNNWQTPNPHEPGGIDMKDMDTLLHSLTRRKFSTVLVCFDGISWFGEPFAPTHGYAKAGSDYKGGTSFQHLSSALSLSVTSIDKHYYLNACFEVTPQDGTEVLRDESAHVAKFTEKFGKPKGRKTLYAPYQESERRFWEEASILLAKEHELIKSTHDKWYQSLPHHIEYCYTLESEQPVTSVMKKAMTETMKGTYWQKGRYPLYARWTVYAYYYRDRYDNVYELTFSFSRKGYQAHAFLSVYSKMFEDNIRLDGKCMNNPDRFPCFFENIIELAHHYVESYAKAYEKIISRADLFDYFHPKLDMRS